ncbi:MAG: hypothetical protein IJP70_06130 [Bacteroidales bacterium]|nr:hypothetical protein [Bacteroidales bacterium]
MQVPSKDNTTGKKAQKGEGLRLLASVVVLPCQQFQFAQLQLKADKAGEYGK